MKVRSGPHPSMYAASSSSRGSPLKNWRKISIISPARIPFAVSAGRYIVAIESIRFTVRSPMPKKRNCEYSGRDMTCGGTSIIIMTIPKRSFLPLKLNLAKPYPVMAQDMTCTSEQPIFSISVFFNVFQKSIA